MADWPRLKDPFAADEIEFRIGRSGIKNGKVWATCLAYVTARAIQDRLDDVFGVGGWKNEYRAGPSGGVVCRIWFKNDDGEWVWREDGGGEMEASRGLSDSDANKGTLSSALKRAGSALGIGRYLYRLEEGFAHVHENGKFRGEAKGDGNERIRFKWDPPSLPAWALPGASKGEGRTNPPAARSRASDAKPAVSTPTLGGSGPHKDTPLVDCPDSVLMEARDALLDMKEKGTPKPAHADKLAAIQAVLAARDEADAASLSGGGET